MAEILEIPRSQLHEQVTERLRALLVEGQIPPGAKLNERKLCEMLRVSRTPLRESIKLLAAEGLVDLVPNRGAVAVKLTEDDVLQSFELLAELEGFSGELAASRISASALAEIRALHFEMMACFERSELSGYYRCNALIHSAVNDSAGNPLLTKMYRQINARVQALRFRTNQNEVKWKQAVREHETMIEALDARDGTALREVMAGHMMNKRDTVLELMRTGDVYVPMGRSP